VLPHILSRYFQGKGRYVNGRNNGRRQKHGQGHGNGAAPRAYFQDLRAGMVLQDTGGRLNQKLRLGTRNQDSRCDRYFQAHKFPPAADISIRLSPHAASYPFTETLAGAFVQQGVAVGIHPGQGPSQDSGKQDGRFPLRLGTIGCFKLKKSPLQGFLYTDAH
jgi:hypothetical protein